MYLPKTLIELTDVSNEYLCLALGMRYPDLFPNFVISADVKWNKKEASKSLFLAPIRVTDMFYLIKIMMKITDKVCAGNKPSSLQSESGLIRKAARNNTSF
jgi:hypothetical protein